MCGSPAQRKRLHALYEYITEEKLELEWRSAVLTLCCAEGVRYALTEMCLIASARYI